MPGVRDGVGGSVTLTLVPDDRNFGHEKKKWRRTNDVPRRSLAIKDNKTVPGSDLAVEFFLYVASSQESVLSLW